MAMNELYRDADSLPYIVEAAVESGDIVVFASGLVGVAETDAVERENGADWATIRTKGVFGIPYTGALTAGTAIYASSTPLQVRGLWVRSPPPRPVTPLSEPCTCRRVPARVLHTLGSVADNVAA